MTQAKLHLETGLKTVTKVRDHEVVIDEPIEQGGTDEGPTPVEAVLAALGACAAITARLYAQRKGWNLESVEIDLNLDRNVSAKDHPLYKGEAEIINVFRQRMNFVGDLTLEQKERLLEIAGRCNVHRVLTTPNLMIEELVTDEELGEHF